MIISLFCHSLKFEVPSILFKFSRTKANSPVMLDVYDFLPVWPPTQGTLSETGRLCTVHLLVMPSVVIPFFGSCYYRPGNTY